MEQNAVRVSLRDLSSTDHTSPLKSVAMLSGMETLQIQMIARSWLARGIALRPVVELTNLELTLSSFTRPSVWAHVTHGKTIECFMAGFSSCYLKFSSLGTVKPSESSIVTQVVASGPIF
jgi:hypothetical protein